MNSHSMLGPLKIRLTLVSVSQDLGNREVEFGEMVQAQKDYHPRQDLTVWLIIAAGNKCYMQSRK